MRKFMMDTTVSTVVEGVEFTSGLVVVSVLEPSEFVATFDSVDEMRAAIDPVQMLEFRWLEDEYGNTLPQWRTDHLLP